MKPECPVCLIMWVLLGIFAGLLIYNNVWRAKGLHA
jgi:hypothetical protein